MELLFIEGGKFIMDPMYESRMIVALERIADSLEMLEKIAKSNADAPSDMARYMRMTGQNIESIEEHLKRIAAK